MRKIKILYISNVFPRPEQNSTIYTDLAEELNNSGNEIIVVASDGDSAYEKTQLKIERGLKVLRVKTGSMYDVGLIKKGISVVTLKFHLISAIKSSTDIISDKIEVLNDIRGILAEKKLEQKILSIMPIILILMLSTSAKDFMRPVFTEIIGRLVMTISITLFVIAYFISEKITNIEV
ncbi:MAG: hypothetical protein A2Y23_05295 [Clostridiales bacterium GWB2_37_7]|nr:MAG: hypothetical protein A2Y23_05295 [Clostridiales bacterium GWB2_37_7]